MQWSATWRMQREQVRLSNGFDMAYVDLAPRAPHDQVVTVVMLHGFTNDADAWADTAAELQRLLPQVRCVIPDLRGHGASAMPPDDRWSSDPIESFTLDRQADDVAALMSRLGIDHAVLVGHSMGSLVAIRLAHRHPGLVKSLALLATSLQTADTPFLSDWLRHDVVHGRWRAQLQRRQVDRQQAMALAPIDLDPSAVRWMRQFWNFYPLTPDRSTEEQAERAARIPLAVWVGASEAILGADLRDDLAELDVPVLVVWGTQDSFFRQTDQQVVVAVLTARARERGQRFTWKQYGIRPLPTNGIQVDDVGHNLTWDAPTAVATDLAAWINTGRPTSNWYRANTPGDPATIVIDQRAAPQHQWHP